MFDTVLSAVVAALTADGIPAFRSFPSNSLDRDSSAVAVGLKSGSITASGYGDYLGIYEDGGVLKELYGSHAKLVIGLDIYAPADEEDEITELLGDICSSIGSLSGVKLRGFEQGETEYDGDTEMLHCGCAVTVSAYLVRDGSGSTLSFTDFSLKGELI